MKLQEIHVKLQQYYEVDAGQLRGAVILAGPTGTQTIFLSMQSIQSIIGVVTEQVCNQAKANAAMVHSSLDDASAEVTLTQVDIPALEG